MHCRVALPVRSSVDGAVDAVVSLPVARHVARAVDDMDAAVVCSEADEEVRGRVVAVAAVLVSSPVPGTMQDGVTEGVQEGGKRESQ